MSDRHRRQDDNDPPLHYDVFQGFPLCGERDPSAFYTPTTNWDHLVRCKGCLARMPDIQFWRSYYRGENHDQAMIAKAARLAQTTRARCG